MPIYRCQRYNFSLIMTYNQLQLADRLQINRVYVARLIKEGRLRAKKIGRSYRIRQNDIEFFLGTRINQKFYTIYNVATILKIHRTTVSRLIHENKLKAVKIGRFFIIPEKEFKKLINQNEIPEKVYTIPELCVLTNTARTNLVRSIGQNKLKAIKIDGEYRISQEEAERFFHTDIGNRLIENRKRYGKQKSEK